MRRVVAVRATGGFSLARRSLEPVAAMAKEAASITAHSLDQRVTVAGGAELVELARVINDLLDRLERAFSQQRRVFPGPPPRPPPPPTTLRGRARRPPGPPGGRGAPRLARGAWGCGGGARH